MTTDTEPRPVSPGDDHNQNHIDKPVLRQNSSRVNAETKPPRNVRKKMLQRLMRRVLLKFLRGFLSGVGLHAGVKLLTTLLKNPFTQTVPTLWQGLLSRDCVRFATFFGLYPSMYYLNATCLQRIREKKDGWNYGLAGGLAGLSVSVLDSPRRRTLAFFTVARALGAGLGTAVARELVQSVPYFEVYVYSACVSLILWCTALRPEVMNPGYYKSILKWSRDFTDRKLTVLFRFVTCQEVDLHPGSCLGHRSIDLLRSLPSFAQLYLPIHLVPVLVFKRKLLIDRPLYVARSIMKNLAISTAFLGLTVYIAKLVICVLRNLVRRPPPLPGFIPALAGAACGLPLLLERKSRRMELSMFVIPQTLSILYIAVQRSRFKGKVGIPHGFTLLFALAMAPVMHAYEREPESLSLLINGLLRFFVGPRSRDTAARSQTKKDDGAGVKFEGTTSSHSGNFSKSSM